jgi:hypothetical protein
MAVTVTWNDGVATPTTFTLSNDVLTSLDLFRLDTLPLYASVQDLITAVINQYAVTPALSRFPTSAMLTAKAAEEAARLALAAAGAAETPVFA